MFREGHWGGRPEAVNVEFEKGGEGVVQIVIFP